MLFSFSSAKATTKPNHNLQPSLEFWEQELEDLERLEEKQIEKGYLKNILKSSSVRLAKKSKTGNVYSETEISAIIKKRLSGLKLTRINGLTYRHRERRTGTTPAPIRELTENEASFSKWACSWISWLATWKFP